MSIQLKSKFFIVLVALLILTLLSWLTLSFLKVSPEVLGVFMILLAFIKVRLIIIHFMELPKTNLAIRLTFEMWIILTGSTTAVLYLL